MIPEYPGLREVTRQEDPRVSFYRGKFHQIIRKFDVNPSSFSSSSSTQTIEAAIRIASGLQIERKFFKKPERALYILAIADTWLRLNQESSYQSYIEKAGLLNLAKEIAHDDKRSFSRSVKRASAAGRLTGKVFDPQNQPSSEEDLNQEIYSELVKAAKSPDIRATHELSALINEQGEGTILQFLRKLSGKKKMSIRLIALPLTEEEMGEKFGGVGMCILIDGKLQLLVARDASRHTLEHEAGHYLFPHFREQENSFPFLGLEEAWVENHIQNPYIYVGPRRVLRELTNADSMLSQALDNAFINPKRNKSHFLTLLTKQYGLRGLLALSRMNPGFEQTYAMGIDPEDVLYELQTIESGKRMIQSQKELQEAALIANRRYAARI